MNRDELFDDLYEAVEGAIPDDLPGYREAYTSAAVHRVLAVIDRLTVVQR